MVNQDSKGVKEFINFMYDQHPVWSLSIVNDSIEAILSTKCLNSLDNGIINATLKADLFGDDRDDCLDPKYRTKSVSPSETHFQRNSGLGRYDVGSLNPV
jgi:hypothetical protein